VSLSFLFAALLMAPAEALAPPAPIPTLLLSRDLLSSFRNSSCEQSSLLLPLVRTRALYPPSTLAHIDLGNLFFARYRMPASRQSAAWKSAVDLACGLALGKSAGVVVGPKDLALGVAALRALAQVAEVPLLAANVRSSSAASARAPFLDGRFLDPAGSAARVAVVAGLWLAAEGSESEAFRREGLELVPMVPALAEASAAFRGRGARQVIGLIRKGLGSEPLPTEALERWVDALVVSDEGPEGFWRWSPGENPRTEPMSARNPDPGGGMSAEAEARVAACAANVPTPSIFRNDYVGVATCSQCHAAAYRHWRRSPHARAMQGVFARRQGANLDCRACHQTEVRLDGTRRASLPFSGVECESCHGPGEGHAAAPTGGTYSVQGTEMRRRCEGCHMADPHQGTFRYSDDLPRVLGHGHKRP
jgi:hypothetical protein